MTLMGHFLSLSLTNLLLQNLVLSHVCNSVSSFCALTAVGPVTRMRQYLLCSLAPTHISQAKVPTPISVFLFSLSFNFPQNASIFKGNLPKGQIMTSHNTSKKQSADLKKIIFFAFWLHFTIKSINDNVNVSPLY